MSYVGAGEVDRGAQVLVELIVGPVLARVPDDAQVLEALAVLERQQRRETAAGPRGRRTHRARRAWVGLVMRLVPLSSPSGFMWPDMSPNRRGSKMRSVNRHVPSTRSNRSWYSPARIGCSPWPVTCSTVKQLRAVAWSPSTPTVTFVIWCRVCGRAVGVDDDAVVDRCGLRPRPVGGGRGGSSRARRARRAPRPRRDRRRRGGTRTRGSAP